MVGWHIVHAWYFCDWLCTGPIGPAAGKLWHCRHSRFTWLTRSSRALVDPCGVWQLLQPSVLMGTCSYTYGPCLSAWHLKHTASPPATVLVWRSVVVPCTLWQSLHCTRPSFTR